MRKIVNSTFISLDGIVNHMDRWHFDYVDDESTAVALEQLTAADGLLLGRNPSGRTRPYSRVTSSPR